MLTIRPVPHEALERRWKAYRDSLPTTAKSMGVPPRPTNVRAILDLGNLIYFEFRGRPYGVPPLPWREGEKLLDAWLELRGLGDQIEPANRDAYYRLLARLTRIIWNNCRPCGHALRALKRLRLLRNPFSGASESEIVDVALFYLGLRTKSTGSFRPGPDAQRI